MSRIVTEEAARITVAGAELCYWSTRCGRRGAPTILLLHGAASNHTRWSEFLELTGLTATCNIVRPDLRGNGASMWLGRLDLDIWASDLHEILRTEATRTVICIGHSLGAQVALRFATRFSGAARALVLIDPIVPHALRGGRRFLFRLRPLLIPAIRLVEIFERLGLGRNSFDELDLRVLDQQTRRELERSTDPDQLARRYSSLALILRHLPFSSYLYELAASVEPLPRLPSLDLPVLTLLSRGTSIADSSSVERELDLLRDGKIVAVEADHWPLTERPNDVCALIEQWLDERRLVPSSDPS